MSDTPEKWTVTGSREIADCRVFKVREDFCDNNGRQASFFVIENPDWVNVIARTNAGEIVLIEQFRHGTGEVTLEIPGGMVDEGEEPETAARRELQEETGFTASEFVFLGRSRPNPALQSNWIHHFLAVDAAKTEDVGFDENESIVTRLVDEASVGDLIRNGEISHSLVTAAFYYLNLAEGK